MKILSIVLGFFVILASEFAVYSFITIENYKQLRTNEVAGIVAYESQRVSGIITEMERNAVDLALSGRQFYLSGEHTAGLGISVIEENFRAFDTAVGGGIRRDTRTQMERHRRGLSERQAQHNTETQRRRQGDPAEEQIILADFANAVTSD